MQKTRLVEAERSNSSHDADTGAEIWDTNVVARRGGFFFRDLNSMDWMPVVAAQMEGRGLPVQITRGKRVLTL